MTRKYLIISYSEPALTSFHWKIWTGISGPGASLLMILSAKGLISCLIWVWHIISRYVILSQCHLQNIRSDVSAIRKITTWWLKQGKTNRHPSWWIISGIIWIWFTAVTTEALINNRYFTCEECNDRKNLYSVPLSIIFRHYIISAWRIHMTATIICIFDKMIWLIFYALCY